MQTFQNLETKLYFDYTDDLSRHDEHWCQEIGATHVLLLPDFITRAAKVLKTVAYVAVDENETGIVWEKWHIKQVK